MANKLKAAYLIMTGEMNNITHISAKLRSRGSVKTALKAAKRLGYKNAHACKMMVSADCVLK